MIKQSREQTEMEGNFSDIINELAALTLSVKERCLEGGLSEDKFTEAFALTTSAQLMARAGMTMEEVEEVLGMKVDREKSSYAN